MGGSYDGGIETEFSESVSAAMESRRVVWIVAMFKQGFDGLDVQFSC